MSEDKFTRREVIKRLVYMTPAILTLPAIPALAKAGSGGANYRGANYSSWSPNGEQGNRGENYSSWSPNGNQGNRGANYSSWSPPG